MNQAGPQVPLIYVHSENQPRVICSYKKQLRSGREAGGQNPTALSPQLYITINKLTQKASVKPRMRDAVL